jgi:hypothetical protein
VTVLGEVVVDGLADPLDRAERLVPQEAVPGVGQRFSRPPAHHDRDDEDLQGFIDPRMNKAAPFEITERGVA